MFSSYRRVFWISVVMALFFFVPFYVTGFSTDVWTRLTRIKEWAEAGFPFTEQLMMGQNYPYGHEMHWTRPLDWIGYAFAWPFIPRWGLKTALEAMAWFVPILTLLVGIRGYFYALKGFVAPKIAFFTFWLFIYGVGYIWGQSTVGYFDHHVFHFTILVWTIGLLLQSVRLKNWKLLVVSALMSVLGTWVTAEFFFNVILFQLSFIFLWWLRGERLTRAIIYLGVFTVGTLLVLTFDHPMSGYLTLDMYRISLIHALLSGIGMVALFLFDCAGRYYGPTKLKRLVILALFGALILSGTLVLMGEVLLVPMVDPYQYHMWTSKVGEMQPLNYVAWFPYCIYPFYMVYFLCFIKWKRLPDKMLSFFLLTAPGLLFGSLLVIPHIRSGLNMGPYFMLVAAFYMNWLFWPREKSTKDTLIFVITYLMFVGILTKGQVILNRLENWGVKYLYDQYKIDNTIEIPNVLKDAFQNYLNQEQNQNNSNKNSKNKKDEHFECEPNQEILDYLRAKDDGLAILTDIFSAPQILWETGHPVLGGPYHTNLRGLSDLFAVQMDVAPFNNAYKILKNRNIGYLYITNPDCENYLFTQDGKSVEVTEKSFQYQLYHQTKQVPKWVKLDHIDEKSQIKIYRLNFKKGKK